MISRNYTTSLAPSLALLSQTEMVARIEAIRRAEGFMGGSWVTFNPPLRPQIVMAPLYPVCRWCGSRLSKQQVRRGTRGCSISHGRRVRRAA